MALHDMVKLKIIDVITCPLRIGGWHDEDGVSQPPLNLSAAGPLGDTTFVCMKNLQQTVLRLHAGYDIVHSVC